MTTDGELYRLMSWLSPAYPVGAYAYSHGLENAVENGLVVDTATACDWIATVISSGNGQSDLVFVCAAWDRAADPQGLVDLNEFALAFQPTAELRLESSAQGKAFTKVSADAWYCRAIDTLEKLPGAEIAYPVAVGALAAGHGICRQTTMLAYAHGFASNLVSAAVRLVPLGQTDGQRITASLMPIAEAAVAEAMDTPFEDVATATPMVDIASMNHESQYTRLFRS
ncbi:MAG: urease accessory protein UreF [Xanthomonadales bacterium]|nr:urease accessory protein UreF [Xanthomonadales bacterium]